MLVRLLVLLFAVAVLLPAAPAEAHRFYRPHVRFGVSYGWGGWWPYAYGGPWSMGVPVAVGQPEIGAVDTDVAPEHARVHLDGVLLGTADDFDGYPGYLLLQPGRYTLEFRLSGYRTLPLDLEVQPGGFFRIDEKLERIPGEEAIPWYDRPPKPQKGIVYGQPKAAAEEPERPFPDLSLRPELGRKLEKGSERRVLRAEAALDLRVTPGRASVYLDGEFLGTGGELGGLVRGVAVGAGRHTIEVLAPGFTTRKLELELAAGERKEIEVELEEVKRERDLGMEGKPSTTRR